MLRQISLATVGLVLGGIISVIGTVAYFTNNPTLNLAGFFYGIPLLYRPSELGIIPYFCQTLRAGKGQLELKQEESFLSSSSMGLLHRKCLINPSFIIYGKVL